MSNYTLFPQMKLTDPQMSVIHTVAIYRKVFSERMDAYWNKTTKRSIVALVKREVLKMDVSDDGTFTVEFANEAVKQAVDEFYYAKDKIRRGHLLPTGTPEMWDNGIRAWKYEPPQQEAEKQEVPLLDQQEPEEPMVTIETIDNHVDADEQDAVGYDERWREAERKAERDMYCIDRYQQRYDNGAFCRMSAQLYAEMSDDRAHITIITILDTALYLCGMNYPHYIEQSREWMKWSLEVKTSNEAYILARKFLGRFAEDDLIPF